MADHEISSASTTDGLPVAPSFGPGLEAEHVERRASGVDRRVLFITGLSMLVAVAAAFVAQGLTHLIGLITNIAFYQRLSTEFVSPAGHQLGLWVIIVPVIGAIAIGLMARYGSKAIRGHGIPEAMEQVLTNESRIPPRMTFLKPISAAISIGTGGPFGAEGPIIATGGSLGSLVGQLLHISADERKTLLAAGAAAGMTATFGSPVSAVLLAIELLLFEYRPRSLIPVALACATANGVRVALIGSAPAFAVSDLTQPSDLALATYVVIGAIVGVGSVLVTRLVYAIEDGFAKLPIHWMWWPALGALPVGIIGYFYPRTMGVGYDNIEMIVSGHLDAFAIVTLCSWKLISWSISLGSGTSGGTLAPLFTIGGGLGGLLAIFAASLLPAGGIDPRIGALVGMAAMFAGASRAVLASVVFAFETTRQPLGLLPLLGGCSAAYLVSCLLMQHSIMTEKIARRGVRVLSEYSIDVLDALFVRDFATKPVTTLTGTQTLAEIRNWLDTAVAASIHQGFPVVDDSGALIGVVTRRDLRDPRQDAGTTVANVIKRPPVVIGEQATLREAADRMVETRVGRLPVVSPSNPQRVVAILSRSDVIRAHERRLRAASAQIVEPRPVTNR
jgi:chloride channel protein, CIC family